MDSKKTFDNEDSMNVLFDALLSGSTGDAIMAQEARGQSKMVNSAVLPREVGYGQDAKAIYESLGIEVTGEADDLFYNVVLPEGWHKKASDHSMWSYLVDDKGHGRADIFYKAAFYDRSAHISFSRRFYVREQPIGGRDNPEYDHKTTPYEVVIEDFGSVVWRKGEVRKGEDWEAFHDAMKDLRAEAEAWLAEHYPDWQNPAAYWD